MAGCMVQKFPTRSVPDSADPAVGGTFPVVAGSCEVDVYAVAAVSVWLRSTRASMVLDQVRA